MKINKKIVNTVLALAIAVPMMGSLTMGDAFAAGKIDFTKIGLNDQGLPGAELVFYKDGVKIFTATTDKDGKIINATNVDSNDKNVYADGSGKLMLKNGDYTYIETKAPKDYILNPDIQSFKITDSSNGPVKFKNSIIKDGKSVVYLRAVDVNNNGLAGAKLELHDSENKVIATFTTTENGYLSSLYSGDINYNGKFNIKNGVLILNSDQKGLYIKEVKEPNGYKLQETKYNLDLSNKESNINVAHEKSGTGVTNPIDHKDPNPANPITTDTGLKLNVIDKMYDGLQNVKLGVYRVDSKGKIIEKVFSGKTGKDGLPDIGNTTIGKDLIAEGGVLDLKPGKYMYRIENVDGMKKHYIDIKQGQVAKRTFRLSDSEIGYLNTNKANGTVRSTSNNVSTTYGNAGTNNTKKLLAKTGSENPIAYTLTGLALAASGAFIFMKK